MGSQQQLLFPPRYNGVKVLGLGFEAPRLRAHVHHHCRVMVLLLEKARAAGGPRLSGCHDCVLQMRDWSRTILVDSRDLYLRMGLQD